MGRYCVLWPECTCGHSWRRWSLVAENEEEWRPDQFLINCAEWQIKSFLDCVSRRCPDPEFRRHATVQLMHPIFGGHIEQ
jgi:hypothetical protein